MSPVLATAGEPVAEAASLRARLGLAGTWRFELDPDDAGVKQRWFARDLTAAIRLPGSLQEQGFGPPPSMESDWAANESSLRTFRTDPRYAPYRTRENFQAPFWLTPRRHYVGPAWYQRDVDIPTAWAGRRIQLHLERPHWQTTAWLDEQELGGHSSLGTPHEFELPPTVAPGRHRLTIRIDNRLNIPVGTPTHAVTDFSQTNWNGIVGEISLRATGPAWLDRVDVYPQVARRSLRVVARIAQRDGRPGRGQLVPVIEPVAPNRHQPAAARAQDVTWGADGGMAEFELSLGPGAALWDEFSPALYRLRLTLTGSDGAPRDAVTTIFGLRQIERRGRQLVLNGRNLLLRGTLECAVFPLTGYPPTDVDAWRRIFRISREYGLNHLRFHTWCPPEAAFVAADEMGFYLQVETSCWGRFGDGGPLDTWMPAEGDRTLRAFGNHPSFVLFSATNEPKGQRSAAFLAGVVARWKAADPRRLYTAGTGANGVQTPESDFYVEYATRFHIGMDGGALRKPPETASDYRTFIQSQDVPCVAHELGQWCVYPDVSTIAKYSGFLRAGHLEIFRDALAASGLLPQARAFVEASGRLQVELYKAEVETVLRTPEMGGYQLLDLHDFPGQGIAPVGVLDEFWDSKGYVTPEEYRRFAGPTVPLARLAQRVFTTDDRTDVEIEVSHFGARDLASAIIDWRVTAADGREVQRGRFEPLLLPTGALTRVGTLPLAFAGWPAAARYTLEVSIAGTGISNRWNLWVFPAHADVPTDDNVTIARQLNDATVAKLAAGGSVLLLPPLEHVAGATHASFAPVFWNRILFPRQRIHTLGLICDPAHPALARFPTAFHSDWQWWDLLERGRPMILDALPRELRPIVQPIDDWNTARRLGLLIEAKVGRGRLVVCSVDLENGLDQRPVARQFRASLLHYMNSSRFRPEVELATEQVRSLLGAGGTSIDPNARTDPYAVPYAVP